MGGFVLLKRIKWAALTLVGILCFSLAGCIGNFYENACTIDGHVISSGLYLVAQYSAYTRAQNLAEDPETDVLKQDIEGEPARDWISRETEESLRKYVCVMRLCREKSITISSEGQSNIDQLMQYWPYMEETYTKNGISQATMQRYTANEQLANQLFTALYDEGGELYTPEEDLKAEYAAMTAHVRFVSAPVNTLAGDDGSAAEDKTAEVTALTDQMVAELESGAKTLEDIAEQDLAKVYELLGRTYDAENALNNISTSYIDLFPDTYDTYSEEFLSKLMTQSSGEFGSYNMGSTIIVYQKIDAFTAEDDFESMRATVLSAVKEDEYENYLRGIYEAYPIDWVPGARGYLSIGKISE